MTTSSISIRLSSEDVIPEIVSSSFLLPEVAGMLYSQVQESGSTFSDSIWADVDALIWGDAEPTE